MPLQCCPYRFMANTNLSGQRPQRLTARRSFPQSREHLPGDDVVSDRGGWLPVGYEGRYGIGCGS